MRTLRGSVSLLVLAGLVVIGSSLIGCGDDESNPATPPVTKASPCDLAARTTSAVALQSEKMTYAVGDSFWVAVALYNVGPPFGASAEIAYPSDRVEVVRVSECANYLSQGQNVKVSRVEPDSNRVSYGVSLVRGGAVGSADDLLLCYLECRAKAAGPAAFTIVTSRLELVKDDGAPIDGLSTVAIENLSIGIQ